MCLVLDVQNQETQQYKEIDEFQFADMLGKLSGEFLKGTETPNGRCRFITKDGNITVLCYFVNGEMLKGPWLFCDYKNDTIRITSPMFNFEVDGSLHFVTAEIQAGKSGTSYTYRDDKLIKKVDSIDAKMLNWILS